MKERTKFWIYMAIQAVYTLFIAGMFSSMFGQNDPGLITIGIVISVAIKWAIYEKMPGIYDSNLRRNSKRIALTEQKLFLFFGLCGLFFFLLCFPSNQWGVKLGCIFLLLVPVGIRKLVRKVL